MTAAGGGVNRPLALAVLLGRAALWIAATVAIVRAVS